MLALVGLAVPLYAHPGGVTNQDEGVGCTQTCHQTPSNVTVVMTADSYSVMQGETFNITINVSGGPAGTPLGVILSMTRGGGTTHPSTHGFTILADPSGTAFNYNQVQAYDGSHSFRWTLRAPSDIINIGMQHKFFLKIMHGGNGVSYYKDNINFYTDGIWIDVLKYYPLPAVSISSPKNGATVSGVVPINATVISQGESRIVQWRLMIDDILIVSTPFTPVHWSMNTLNYSFGLHTIKVQVQDYYGRLSLQTVSVYVNNGVPQVNIAAPRNGEVVEGMLEIAANISGPQPMDYVNLLIDGALIFNTTAPYNWSLNTSNYSDGQHRLEVRAFDISRSTGSQVITIMINNTGSAVSIPAVDIQSPINGAILNGTATVSVQVESEQPLLFVRLSLDGTMMYNWTSAPYTTPLNTVQLADGTHLVNVTARDSQAHEGYQQITVTVSNAPPVIDFSNPLPGANLKGNVLINASSPLSTAIKWVHLSIDGVLLGNLSGTPYLWYFATDNVPNGQHLLNLTAFGKSGKNGHAEISVFVTNPGPIATVKLPASGATIKDKMDMSATALGTRPIAYVSFRIDGGAVANVTSTPYSASLDSTGFPNGGHRLNVTAVDDLGRPGFSEITFSIDNPPASNGGGNADMTLPIVGVLVAVAVVGALLVLVRRRKGR